MEKIIKAVYVNIKNDFAPKTYNLLYLCELCKIELTEEQIFFYAILMKYQIAGRYPDNTGHTPGRIIVTWIYAVKVDPGIEPVAVGSRRFQDDAGSPLIEIVKKEGMRIM